jgi:hypothetical protein
MNRDRASLWLERGIASQHPDGSEDRSAARMFWQHTVEWVIRHRDQLTDASCAAILEWAMHLYTEGRRRYGGAPPFSWSGRQPGPAHAAALEYQRQRDKPYGDLSWNGHGLDWERREGERVIWSLRELTTSKDLLEEGRAMRHCVASYAYRCVQNHSAIFSLRAGEERKLTVELDLHHRRIVQARGSCNRAATPAEEEALARWLKEKSSA